MPGFKDWELPQRYREFIFGRWAAVASLVVLWTFNFLWYSGFTFKTLMGDDLWRWLTFSDPQVLRRIIVPPGDKYRPLLDLFQYPLFKVFSANYQSWLFFNTLLNCVVIAALFLLVRRLAKGDSLVAFAAAFVYITSRFAFYSVLQVWGEMESLGLLLMLLMLHAALSYVERPRLGPGLWISALYFVTIFTDERYIVLLPFILLLFWLAEKPEGTSKWALMGLGALPLVLNVFVKKVVFNLHYLSGVEGRPITFSPMQIVQFTKDALLNVLWVSVGDSSQLGVSAQNVALGRTFVIFTIIAIVVGTIAVAWVRTIGHEDADERKREVRGAILWGVLFASLLISSAVTFRQELRWFTAAFVVLMVYFFYLYSKLHTGWTVKYGLLALLLVLVFSTDVYYRSFLHDIYYFYSQQMADSALAQTYGTYGPSIEDYSIYLDKQAGLDWILADGNFLAPYVGTNYNKVHWMDNRDDANWAGMDRSKVLFYRLDWPNRKLVNVTDELLASHPATGVPAPVTPAVAPIPTQSQLATSAK